MVSRDLWAKFLFLNLVPLIALSSRYAVAGGPDWEECKIKLLRLTSSQTVTGYYEELKPELKRLNRILVRDGWVPAGTQVGADGVGDYTLYSDPTHLVGRTVFGIQTPGGVLIDAIADVKGDAVEKVHRLNTLLKGAPTLRLYGGRVNGISPVRTKEGPDMWHFELTTTEEKTETLNFTTAGKVHVLLSPGEQFGTEGFTRFTPHALPLQNEVLKAMNLENGETRQVALKILISKVIGDDSLGLASQAELDELQTFMTAGSSRKLEIRPWILKQYPTLAMACTNLPRLHALIKQIGQKAGKERWLTEQAENFGASVLEVHRLIQFE